MKANLWVFVNSSIVNPAFDSQTKETLNTKKANFGSTFELTEKFMKEVLDSGRVLHRLRRLFGGRTSGFAQILK